MWTEAIAWILGLFVVAVILFVLFFPDQTLSKVKDAALNFGFGLLPEERKPEFQGEDQVTEEVKSQFSELASKFNEKYAEDSCMIKLENKLETGDLLITISTKTKKINVEKKKEDGLTFPYESNNILNAPCIVNPQNFYNYYFDGNKDLKENLIIPTDITIENDEIVYNGEKYSFDQNNLFKNDDNVCFFLIHSGTGTYNILKWYNKFGCDAEGNTLDNDCINDINDKDAEPNIPQCTKVS